MLPGSVSRGTTPSAGECGPSLMVSAPPSGFRSAEGVTSAWPVSKGPFARPPTLRGRSAAQKIGIRYERKALARLSQEHGAAFIPHQWLKYRVGDNTHFCQPDGLHFEGECITIVEVKARFTSDAWWQLKKLYGPVVQRAYTPKQLEYLIICKSFDPWTSFPEEYNTILRFTHAKRGVINVYPWRL